SSRNGCSRKCQGLRSERESASCDSPLGLSGPDLAGRGPRPSATGHRLRVAFRCTGRVAASTRATAVFGEVRNQTVHRLEIRAVVDEPALLPRTNQPGVGELLQVKRKRCGRHIEHLRDLARRETGGSLLDQKTEEREPSVLRERSESLERCR